MLRYYQCLFRHAWSNTTRFANRQGIGIGLVIAVLTAIITGRVSAAMGEAFNTRVAIFSAVEAVLLVGVIVFVWQWARAPYLMWMELSRSVAAADQRGDVRRAAEQLTSLREAGV